MKIASRINNIYMNKSYVKRLGAHIKSLRSDRKLTQDDIGINGISRSMISLLEIGATDITVSKLKIIADNIGLKVKDLFDFE